MWSPRTWPVLGLILSAAAACSSPLEEYVCRGDSDCGGVSGLARCEQESGHCSFFDPTCLESGYRYGESSGVESGLCVADDGGSTSGFDAGPGTTVQRPIAALELTEQAFCGTDVVATGAGSRAFDGAVVESYQWTLLDGGGQVIDTFSGPPTERIPLGLHRLGGDFLNPRVNFPSYHGDIGMRGSVDQGPRSSIYQKAVDLGPNPFDQTYRLFFAVGVDPNADSSNGMSVTARLVSGSETLIEQAFPGALGRFVGHEVVFDLSEVGGPNNLEDVRLEFRFDGLGRRWLDNVGLVRVANEMLITSNRSVESGDEDPWKFGDGVVGTTGLTARTLEPEMREEREYVLQLQVSDSNGEMSEIADVSVGTPDCL